MCGFLFGSRSLHRLEESGVFLVTGKVLNEVGNRYLEDDVHTALEVQTQTDLCLQTFLVGVDTEILHGVLVVLLGDGVLDFCGFPVVIT